MARFSRDALSRRIVWEEIDGDHVRRLIDMARAEDLAGLGLQTPPLQTGDPTTALMPVGRRGQAYLTARHAQVVCGLGVIPLVLEVYGGGVTARPLVADGAWVAAGAHWAELTGPVEALLQAERVMLNMLQHLAGVATHTARYVQALGPTATRLLDTRKTTPGFRILEKYAVACGGAYNHRLGLFDRVLLKDNHLAAAESAQGEALATLVRLARERHPTLPLEAEVDRLEQIPPIVAAGADVILLDNFTPGQLRQAVAMVAGRCYTEASGGITLESLPVLAGLGLDFLSAGALVHRAPWADLGLDWQP